VNTSKDPTELRARRAILSIFRDLGISAAETLSETEITQLWPEYGVRTGDLSWAIEGLVHDGMLARAADAPDHLVLTAVGERWLREQPAWLEYRLVVLRAARARCRRRNGEPAPAAIVLRRSSDAPTLIGGA
jgi:hypothetical protein